MQCDWPGTPPPRCWPGHSVRGRSSIQVLCISDGTAASDSQLVLSPLRSAVSGHFLTGCDMQLTPQQVVTRRRQTETSKLVLLHPKLANDGLSCMLGYIA
jgi:hypothetical protein